MFETLRNFRFPYIAYNFFHRKQLAHNIPLYRKFGIKKKYYSSVSSADFKHTPHKEREVNRERLISTAFVKSLSEENRQNVLDFEDKGYAIIRGFLSSEEVDAVNRDIEKLMQNGTLKFRYINKLMFAIHHSETTRKIGNSSDLLEFLSVLMDGEAKLFQSINFINGSQQKTHSDSIHMTTFPLGGLIGIWIALEDIEPEQGALHYIEKSHKLPYYLNSDYDNEGDFLRIGKKKYKEYEVFLARKVEELGLEKKIFHAKKGDMLIWHANILHGGEPHTNKQKTRKSMVFHYFDKGSICYHEVTQRPALFEI